MKFLFWNLYETDDIELHSIDVTDQAVQHILRDMDISLEIYCNLYHRDAKLKQICKETYNEKIIYFAPLECRLFFPGVLDEIYNILIKNQSTLEIWIGNFEETQSFSSIGIAEPNDTISTVNWNKLLMYESFDNYQTLHLKTPDVEIDKAFVCLNNRITHYRSKLIESIAKEQLLCHGYVSWLKMFDDNRHDDIFVHFDNKSVSLSGTSQFSHELSSSEIIFEENYFKGFVNIIAEGEIVLKDISEKTHYAILHKKPFLILGPVGIHKELTKMGFKLHDDIFDYTFDNELDLDKRIHAIISNIKQIIGTDYNELRVKILDVLDYNYNRYLEILNDPSSVPAQFWDYLKILNSDHSKNEKINSYHSLLLPFNVSRPT
jgi:hypothetical protein